MLKRWESQGKWRTEYVIWEKKNGEEDIGTVEIDQGLDINWVDTTEIGMEGVMGTTLNPKPPHWMGILQAMCGPQSTSGYGRLMETGCIPTTGVICLE